MAVKGAVFKKEITDTILQTFPGSFLYNDGKEIRLVGMEDGQEIQVKVTLTCAKVNVEPNGDNVLPGTVVATSVSDTAVSTPAVSAEITQEEKDNVVKLMQALGL